MAIAALQRDVPSASLRVLRPDTTAGDLEHVPADDAEARGMGASLGGVVGGAAGLAAATALVPPAGFVTIIGLAAGALLGAGGGMIAGNAVEEAGDYGLPRDDLFVYADALRQGRTVVIAEVEEEEKADRARDAMQAAGAESVDAAARQAWWTSLRDGESAQYDGGAAAFDRVESEYRRGFESACRGEEGDPDSSEACRRGYDRGRLYMGRTVH